MQMGNPGSNTTNTDDAATEKTRTGTSMSTDPKKRCWRKMAEHALNWMAHKDKDEWLKDMRGNLSLVATVISTMTFQVAINPPGGVKPTNDQGLILCPAENNTCTGQAVLAVVTPDDYELFLLCNTVCFVASLSVCLLLVSGIPLHHRFPMWLLSIGMCVTLTNLALTYIISVSMVTPGRFFGSAAAILQNVIYVWAILQNVIYVWVGLLSLVGLLLTIRFVIWVVKLFIRTRKNKTTETPKITNQNIPLI